MSLRRVAIQVDDEDADAARAELIRLGCTTKSGKRPIQPKEAAWIEANWRRLLPSIPALTLPDWLMIRRKGRALEMMVGWHDDGRLRNSFLDPEFDRGFVRRFRFKTRPTYDRFWAALASQILNPPASFNLFKLNCFGATSLI